jgi:shikimate dehydrogenase/3-dehydroquinate dehydratase type I
MEIVATFVPASGREPAVELGHPPTGATTVELRADLLGADRDLAPLISACPLPVVVTLRSRAEGGDGPDDAPARRRFFARAAALPAVLVDLEVARDRELVDSLVPAERVILSAHLAGAVPADLEERAAAMLAARTRYVKIVPTTATLAELMAVLRLAQAVDRGSRSSRRAVVFAAGEHGRATRLLGPLFGAPLAFAAWAPDRPGAAGQYVPEELIALIGHLSGRPRRLFAVLGASAGESLSPRMHAAAYRAVGLANLFVPLAVGDEAELDALVRPAGESCLDEVALPVGGFAVTMPWKGAASRRCTVLAPRAERAKAVNTVIIRPGKVLGDCTDIDGITRVLAEEGVELAELPVLVLGAGGAARAAVVALQLAGARVTVAARDTARAGEVAEALGAASADVGASVAASVVINATPAGADGRASRWLEALRLPEAGLVVDLAYGPQPTFLEQLAAGRGWRFVGGREVLLYQAVSQFAAMNGVAPPVRAMAGAIGLEETQG